MPILATPNARPSSPPPQAGYRNALLAGAPNLGLTNWLTRVEMNASLTRALLATSRPACAADEVVGVFLHLDSCAAFHGPQVCQGRGVGWGGGGEVRGHRGACTGQCWVWGAVVRE